MPEGFQLSPMLASDYDEVLALWNSCDGVRADETREEFARILVRNPGLSAVIRQQRTLAAAVLCCHDGRRGYLYHMGVASEFRRLGLGRLLVEHSLASLQAEGVQRCTIFLIVGNLIGEAFWKRTGWRERVEVKVLARDL
jgi:ribosomal protein S18 acetylase RimI-like enzyme